MISHDFMQEHNAIYSLCLFFIYLKIILLLLHFVVVQDNQNEK